MTRIPFLLMQTKSLAITHKCETTTESLEASVAKYRPYSTANMNIFLCDMHVT